MSKSVLPVRNRTGLRRVKPAEKKETGGVDHVSFKVNP